MCQKLGVFVFSLLVIMASGGKTRTREKARRLTKDGVTELAVQKDTNLETNWSEPQDSRSMNIPKAADCQCGRVNRRNRIVDGHETEVLEYPWQAKIFANGHGVNKTCSGSLINSKWILSSTYCAFTQIPSDIKVILGEHTFNIADGTEQRFDVTRLIHHPSEFNPGYKVSLLELSNEVDFSGTWKPICLPSTEEDFVGANAIVTGWERPDKKIDPSDNRVLLVYEVPVVSNRDCAEFYSKYSHFRMEDSLICAGDQHRHSSCQGDWGSPLITSLGEYYVQIGVSDGDLWGCDSFGLYTRVTAFLPWIERVAMTGNVKVCQP